MSSITAVATTSKKTVLVVDDNPTNLTILHMILRRMDIRVLVAEDGRSALERAELAQPDLILLDVMMPGIDGFETCQKLKLNRHTQSIPVIFLSALDDRDYTEKARAAGGVDYIIKPIKQDDLENKVKKHLPMDPPPQKPSQKATVPGLNWTAFMDAMAHDLRGQLAIAEGYLEALMDSCDTLTDYPELSEYAGIATRSIAHINRIVETMVTLRSLPEYASQPTSVDLDCCLRRLFDEYSGGKPMDWVQFSFDAQANITTDVTLLESAFKGLFWLATVLRGDGSTKPVLLDGKALEDGYRICIEIAGRKLNERECEALFKTDFQDKKSKVAGIGIAMMATSAILKLLRVEAKVYPMDDGTRMTLFIPSSIEG